MPVPPAELLWPEVVVSQKLLLTVPEGLNPTSPPMLPPLTRLTLPVE